MIVTSGFLFAIFAHSVEKHHENRGLPMKWHGIKER